MRELLWNGQVHASQGGDKIEILQFGGVPRVRVVHPDAITHSVRISFSGAVQVSISPEMAGELLAALQDALCEMVA